MTENNINESIKNLITQEEQLVKGIAMQISAMNNIPVRLALRAMGLDSIKHTEYLRGALEIIQSPLEPETEEEKHRYQEHVQQQVQREETIIHQIENLKEKNKDQRLIILLDSIKQDHMRNIQTLKKIQTMNTSIDADYWPKIFKQ